MPNYDPTGFLGLGSPSLYSPFGDQQRAYLAHLAAQQNMQNLYHLQAQSLAQMAQLQNDLGVRGPNTHDLSGMAGACSLWDDVEECREWILKGEDPTNYFFGRTIAECVDKYFMDDPWDEEGGGGL